MPKLRTAVHRDTGEIFDLVEQDDHGGSQKPKTVAHSDLYLFLYYPGLRRLASDTTLTGTDYRVLLSYLMTGSPNDDDWATDHQRIARRLGVTEQQVQKSTGKLVTAGHLLRPRKGRLAHNVLLSWRGSSTNRETRKNALLAE